MKAKVPRAGPLRYIWPCVCPSPFIGCSKHLTHLGNSPSFFLKKEWHPDFRPLLPKGQHTFQQKAH